jgi:hypothetical protein
MKSRHILAALATASLIAGGSALAQGRGGGHGQGHGAGGLGVNVGGSAQGGVRAGADPIRVNTGVNTGVDVRQQTGTRVGRDFGVRTRTDARVNSQGPANANPRARARANGNSVLATGRTGADLSALRTGLTVRNTAGATLGTIVRINRANDGRIVNVLVRAQDGRRRTLPVAPNTISVSGDVVTTTVVGLR